MKDPPPGPLHCFMGLGGGVEVWGGGGGGVGGGFWGGGFGGWGELTMV